MRNSIINELKKVEDQLSISNSNRVIDKLNDKKIKLENELINSLVLYKNKYITIYKVDNDTLYLFSDFYKNITGHNYIIKIGNRYKLLSIRSFRDLIQYLDV